MTPVWSLSSGLLKRLVRLVLLMMVHSNIVLVEHVIDVKVVVGENVISQFCCCGAVAEKV